MAPPLKFKSNGHVGGDESDVSVRPRGEMDEREGGIRWRLGGGEAAVAPKNGVEAIIFDTGENFLTYHLRCTNFYNTPCAHICLYPFSSVVFRH